MDPCVRGWVAGETYLECLGLLTLWSASIKAFSCWALAPGRGQSWCQRAGGPGSPGLHAMRASPPFHPNVMRGVAWQPTVASMESMESRWYRTCMVLGDHRDDFFDRTRLCDPWKLRRLVELKVWKVLMTRRKSFMVPAHRIRRRHCRYGVGTYSRVGCPRRRNFKGASRLRICI